MRKIYTQADTGQRRAERSNHPRVLATVGAMPRTMKGRYTMMNVRIHDNGACFMICVNGLQVIGFNTLGKAWRHIAYMRVIASQEFTVGEKEIPAQEWIDSMKKLGFLEDNAGYEEKGHTL